MNGAAHDPIFLAAMEAWHDARAEFADLHENAYQLAETACNGVLLNAAGKRAGIDPYSLFIGTNTRARKYASEELLDHWTRHPRIGVNEYMRQRAAHDPRLAAIA